MHKRLIFNDTIAFDSIRGDEGAARPGDIPREQTLTRVRARHAKT
ncbi:thymidine phosphorylase domain protein [Burkholderia thailandensis]|uniref:Thymidine phosphorylase domain protein n=1 Tax=Burkholderia thailandensis TaxID=57975 RepID=A0AAW9CWZ2_BURTH|nr:thymidine phosphorylase domain protein [Burkholderia thailandensis]MDW9252251.1 thymidine phosphorylase domain protein [Burkholderia thailandensis]